METDAVPEGTAWVAVALVLIGLLGGGVVLAEWPMWGVEPTEPEEPHMVEPVENGTQLWPYTARATDFTSRTLGINVVFFGDPDMIHSALVDRTTLEWEDEQVHEGDADAETVSLDRVEVDLEADDPLDIISWGDAEGSVRYTYVRTGGEGQWMDESYQLHAGTYLGYRLHIRGYEDTAGEWTAVQIHDEHWDWFRLRHTVTGISDPQQELEREFMHEPFVEDVIRIPFENPTADGDGWATGITIASAGLPIILGLFSALDRIRRNVVTFIFHHRRAVVLGLALFFLYTGIRWVGIAGELLFPGVSPKVIAAPLYLIFVGGTPLLAYWFGRGTDATWAFTFGVLGLGTAILVDLVAMNVAVLPLRVIIHRLAVVLTVGLIALGGVASIHEERPAPLLVGLFGWMLALVLPLFGYL